MTKTKGTVFISYATEDYMIAQRIYNDLKIKGIKVWLDRHDLVPGQKGKMSITHTIQNCSYVVALISKNSVEKKGIVQYELKAALEVLDTLPPNKIFLIPVRLDDCDPSDLMLAELHWADFQFSYEVGLRQLLNALDVKGEEGISTQQPTLYNLPTTYNINLGREIAVGGQARIYDCLNKPFSAIKIYHANAAPPLQKLELLKRNPPIDPMISASNTSFAWIKSVISDKQHNVIGFEMPKVRGAKPIHLLYTPSSRALHFPQFTWKDIHKTAL